MHHCAASSNAASSAGGVAGRSGGATSLASASFLRWSSATRERFLRAPLEAGRVHSVFERAVNMLWHDGRLVTLQGPTPLVAPFAATVSRLPKVGNVTPGMAIRQCDGRILFGAVSLSWEGAVLAETRIQPTDESPGLLGIVLAEQVMPPVASALHSPAGREARRLLAHGIRSLDAVAFIQGARMLIGLGEGLTPAGDDCLVGALAVLRRFARPWLVSHPEIAAALSAAVGDGTTIVGQEFILHALDGLFSEVVLQLVTATSVEDVRRAATQLLAMGGTSGADTLQGMELALEAIRR